MIMTNLQLWLLSIWVSSTLTGDRDCAVQRRKKKKNWTTIAVNLHVKCVKPKPSAAVSQSTDIIDQMKDLYKIL